MRPALYALSAGDHFGESERYSKRRSLCVILGVSLAVDGLLMLAAVAVFATG